MTKTLEEMTPDEVCAYVKKTIRRKLGDDAENRSNVFCKHGSYYVELPGRETVGMKRKRLPEFLKGL